MNYETAKKVLDRTKDGTIYPTWVITSALYFTGDLEFDERNGSSRMAGALSGESLRARQERGETLVE